jgi:hypothetical protein
VRPAPYRSVRCESRATFWTSGRKSEAARIANRIPPIIARLNTISASQNVCGTSTPQGTPTTFEVSQMNSVISVPTDTAATIRSRSGTLAKRQVRSYRPSRTSAAVRTIRRSATNGRYAVMIPGVPKPSYRRATAR